MTTGQDRPDDSSAPAPAAPPLTLGEQLKEVRQSHRLTLDEVETATKVRLKHLQAIEDARYQALPPDVFAVGFVRRYARHLGLDPEVAATMFRKERAERRAQRVKSPAFRMASSALHFPFVISPRLLISASVVLVVLLLFGYIWYQVRIFAAPPQLTLNEPVQDTIALTDTVTVEGKTTPTANLFINNEAVPLDAEGGFRQDVKLTVGVNAVEVKAVSRLGKETVKVINVLYQSIEPTTNQELLAPIP